MTRRLGDGDDKEEPGELQPGPATARERHGADGKQRRGDDEGAEAITEPPRPPGDPVPPVGVDATEVEAHGADRGAHGRAQRRHHNERHHVAGPVERRAGTPVRTSTRRRPHSREGVARRHAEGAAERYSPVEPVDRQRAERHSRPEPSTAHEQHGEGEPGGGPHRGDVARQRSERQPQPGQQVVGDRQKDDVAEEAEMSDGTAQRRPEFLEGTLSSEGTAFPDRAESPDQATCLVARATPP